MVKFIALEFFCFQDNPVKKKIDGLMILYRCISMVDTIHSTYVYSH